MVKALTDVFTGNALTCRSVRVQHLDEAQEPDDVADRRAVHQLPPQLGLNGAGDAALVLRLPPRDLLLKLVEIQVACRKPAALAHGAIWQRPPSETFKT